MNVVINFKKPYIYIYVCVCVCVCVAEKGVNDLIKHQATNQWIFISLNREKSLTLPHRQKNEATKS